MTWFEIVAHRGAPAESPENTFPAFQRAIAMGADAVELDVRLTRDHVPVVFHYFYLDEITNLTGPVFNFTYQQLSQARFRPEKAQNEDFFRIPTLQQVLESIGGQIGLEIEIKGPEPEAPVIIGKLLREYRALWESLEITSYEPELLLAIQKECPGIVADLLSPRSEPWMGLDVVAYTAIHRARLAKARAVHLHPTQLSMTVVESIRKAGIEIHAWDVNDDQSLELVVKHQISKISTDRLGDAMLYRSGFKG
jgi:glycerophosphoryl diester phosphodiesterase